MRQFFKCFYFRFPFLERQVEKEGEGEQDREIHLPSAGTFRGYLREPGLGPGKGRSPTLHPDLPHG